MVLVGFYYSMGQITVCFDLLLDSLLKKEEKVAFFFFFFFTCVSVMQKGQVMEGDEMPGRV